MCVATTRPTPAPRWRAERPAQREQPHCDLVALARARAVDSQLSDGTSGGAEVRILLE